MGRLVGIGARGQSLAFRGRGDLRNRLRPSSGLRRKARQARIYAHALDDDRRAADTWESVVAGDGGVAGDGAVTGTAQ